MTRKELAKIKETVNSGEELNPNPKGFINTINRLIDVIENGFADDPKPTQIITFCEHCHKKSIVDVPKGEHIPPNVLCHKTTEQAIPTICTDRSECDNDIFCDDCVELMNEVAYLSGRIESLEKIIEIILKK